MKQLFNELKVNKSKVAFIIEQEIWALWSIHPTDEKLTAKLEEGSQFVKDQNYIKAKDILLKLLILIKIGLKLGIKEQLFFTCYENFKSHKMI